MTDLVARREPWRYAVRIVVSIAAVAPIVGWLFPSWTLWTFRCDENCGVGDYDRWQWTGQAVLAVAGALGAIAALGLRFTRSGAYRAALALAIGCGVAWVFWVFVVGGF